LTANPGVHLHDRSLIAKIPPHRVLKETCRSLLPTMLAATLVACGGGDGNSGPPPGPPGPPVSGPAWTAFAGNAQHAAIAAIAAQPLQRIVWQTPVDLSPQYGGGGSYLPTHYGSPVISSHNTVLVPLKVGASGSFRIEARNGSNGALLWRANTDYVVPRHNWFPSYT
jgi:hypothetical protein